MLRRRILTSDSSANALILGSVKLSWHPDAKSPLNSAPYARVIYSCVEPQRHTFSRLDERSVEAHLGAQGEAHAGLPIAIRFMSVLERGVVCSRGAVSGEFPWKSGTQRPRRRRHGDPALF